MVNEGEDHELPSRRIPAQIGREGRQNLGHELQWDEELFVTLEGSTDELTNLTADAYRGDSSLQLHRDAANHDAESGWTRTRKRESDDWIQLLRAEHGTGGCEHQGNPLAA